MDISGKLTYIIIFILVLLAAITFLNLTKYFANEESSDSELRKKHQAIKSRAMYLTTMFVISLFILGYFLFRIASCTKI
jgi:Na+/H+ antiporter NhaD/arsenite permease-like protein